jgi:hypothetical protein
VTALAAVWIDWRCQRREDRTRWNKERLLVYSEFLTAASQVDKAYLSTDDLS